MHIEADDLVAALRRAGLRITAPRRAVCEILAESHDEHLTAATLLARVTDRLGRVGSEIAPSTIYRSIDVLEQEGLLHHIHFGHGPGVLHLSDDPRHGHVAHHHLVCEQCGRTVDVEASTVGGALEQIADKHDFVMNSVHFALVGRCRSCA